jgi:hypothetical protein
MDERAEIVVERPWGIRIIAVWLMIVGLGMGAVLMYMRVQPEGAQRTGEALASVGISGRWVLLSAIFLAGMTILAGVALWLGEPAGWWLGSFCALYGIARIASAFHLLSQLRSRCDVVKLDEPRMTTLLMRGGINLVILGYLARTESMEYLGVPSRSRVRSLVVLALVVSAVCGLSFVLSRVK